MKPNKKLAFYVKIYTDKVAVFVICVFTAFIISSCAIYSIAPSSLYGEQHTELVEDQPAHIFTESESHTINRVSENTTLMLLRGFDNWSETIAQTAENDIAKVNLNHFTLQHLYNEETRPHMGIHADITYPFFFEMGDGFVETVANSTINMFLYTVLGDDFGAERLIYLQQTMERGDLGNYDGPSVGFNITCDIAYFSERYVSFIFRNQMFLGGTRPVTDAAFLTIDLFSGEPLELCEVYCRAVILEAMETGRFHIEEGMYLPAGWSADDEDARYFIAEIVKHVLIENGLTMESVFDTFRPQDFIVVSETQALLKVNYNDSLHGYVVIRLFMSVEDEVPIVQETQILAYERPAHWPEDLQDYIPGTVHLFENPMDFFGGEWASVPQRRLVFYSIDGAFINLVTHEEWAAFRYAVPTPDDIPDTMPLVEFIQYFDLSMEQLLPVVDQMRETRQSLVENLTQTMLDDQARERADPDVEPDLSSWPWYNPRADLNHEFNEIPNLDIIFTFDNDIINWYYRRE